MKLNPAILSIAALVAAALPSAVLAADMPAPDLAPMAMAPPAVYDWSGLYLGGQIGYGWSQSNTGTVSFFDDPTLPATATIPGFGVAGSGLLGGIEAGYNWQAGNFLFGVEGDVSAAGIKGSYTDAATGFSVDSNINWLSTARVRVGLPFDRFLLFASGGLAVAGITGNLHDTYVGNIPPVLNTSSSNTGVGWTIGGGAAVALGSRWTLKGEYLYADLGSKTYNFSEPAPGFPLISTSARTTASIVRVGLDYRF